MARMFPDFVHPDCKSDAEKKIFRRLRDELPDEYVVLHSLGLPKHPEKLWGEIDFAVIGPPGVLCIEVKGGRVAYRDGRWHFTNRSGDTNSKAESPMDQARKAMYAMRNAVREECGKNSSAHRCVYGYATFFVDHDFDENSREWDLRRITGHSALNAKTLRSVVEGHFDYSREELERVTGRQQTLRLGPTLVDDLRKCFRSDFDLVPSLGTRIEASCTELIRLTKIQLKVLDKLFSPRLLVQGGAGTGKTLLALEKARRHYLAGEQVLFLCFNGLLARTLAARVAQEGFEDRIHVSTLHAFCHETIMKAGMEGKIPEGIEVGSSGYFSEVIPSLFPKAFCEVHDKTPYDVLVVDEGQDLKGQSDYMDLLDWLIVGGLKDGRWAWFEDDRQSIFNVRADLRPSDLGGFEPTVMRLTENCRNTAPVASFVSVTTQTDLDECLQTEGPEVRHVYYRDSGHQLKLLDSAIRDVIGDGIPTENVVVLSAARDGSCLASQLPPSCRYSLEELGFSRYPQAGRIGFTTAGRFKGLESRVVIVTDVESLETGKDLRRLYVAMTRANAYLVVLMNEGLKEKFEERYSEFAKAILAKARTKGGDDAADSPFTSGI